MGIKTTFGFQMILRLRSIELVSWSHAVKLWEFWSATTHPIRANLLVFLLLFFNAKHYLDLTGLEELKERVLDLITIATLGTAPVWTSVSSTYQ